MYIHQKLAGRTIDIVGKDKSHLIIRTLDGQDIYIGWRDKAGNQVEGEPFIAREDTRVVLDASKLKILGTARGPR